MHKKLKTQHRTLLTAVLVLIMLAFSSASFAWGDWGRDRDRDRDGCRWNCESGSTIKAPELNPGQLGIGLMLAVGGMLAMTGRQKKRK